jgi:hypothetical protein
MSDVNYNAVDALTRDALDKLCGLPVIDSGDIDEQIRAAARRCVVAPSFVEIIMVKRRMHDLLTQEGYVPTYEKPRG